MDPPPWVIVGSVADRELGGIEPPYNH